MTEDGNRVQAGRKKASPFVSPFPHIVLEVVAIPQILWLDLFSADELWLVAYCVGRSLCQLWSLLLSVMYCHLKSHNPLKLATAIHESLQQYFYLHSQCYTQFLGSKHLHDLSVDTCSQHSIFLHIFLCTLCMVKMKLNCPYYNCIINYLKTQWYRLKGNNASF